ncbi:MAG: glutaredoxin family protein [Chloroflexota bacterium]
MKDFLDQRGVRYTLKNLNLDPGAREEFVQRGFLLPPVTVLGTVVVEGFDRDRLEELFDRGETSLDTT